MDHPWKTIKDDESEQLFRVGDTVTVALWAKEACRFGSNAPGWNEGPMTRFIGKEWVIVDVDDIRRSNQIHTRWYALRGKNDLYWFPASAFEEALRPDAARMYKGRRHRPRPTNEAVGGPHFLPGQRVRVLPGAEDENRKYSTRVADGGRAALGKFGTVVSLSVFRMEPPIYSVVMDEPVGEVIYFEGNLPEVMREMGHGVNVPVVWFHEGGLEDAVPVYKTRRRPRSTNEGKTSSVGFHVGQRVSSTAGPSGRPCTGRVVAFMISSNDDDDDEIGCRITFEWSSDVTNVAIQLDGKKGHGCFVGDLGELCPGGDGWWVYPKDLKPEGPPDASRMYPSRRRTRGFGTFTNESLGTEEEMDRLLDKVGRTGRESLTPSEAEALYFGRNRLDSGDEIPEDTPFSWGKVRIVRGGATFRYGAEGKYPERPTPRWIRETMIALAERAAKKAGIPFEKDGSVIRIGGATLRTNIGPHQGGVFGSDEDVRRVIAAMTDHSKEHGKGIGISCDTWVTDGMEFDRDGHIRWFKNGKFHREDGPAVITKVGTKAWYVDGAFHREDGPAVEKADGEILWREHGKAYDPSPDQVDDYLRRRLAEDPNFATHPIFRKNATRELLDEHPEAGSDFGFFDAGRTNEGKSEVVYRPGDHVLLDHRTAKGELGVFDESTVWVVVNGVEYKGDYFIKKVGSLDYDVIAANYRKMIHVDKYIRRKIVEDPMFVTTELFRRFAPKDLRDQYPEAGVDFGFFDAKKNESASYTPRCGPVMISREGRTRDLVTQREVYFIHHPENSLGGKVWAVRIGTFCKNPLSSSSVYGAIYNRTATREDLMVSPAELRALEAQEVVVVDRYLGSPTQLTPTLGTVSIRETLAKKYGTEPSTDPSLVRGAFPELGSDFGFFDTKRNESIQDILALPDRAAAFLNPEYIRIHRHVRKGRVNVTNIGPDKPESGNLSPWNVKINFRTPDFEYELRRFALWSPAGHEGRQCRGTLQRTRFGTAGGTEDRETVNLVYRMLIGIDFAAEQVRRNPSLMNPYMTLLGERGRTRLRGIVPEAGADFGFFDINKVDEGKKERMEYHQGDLVLRRVNADLSFARKGIFDESTVWRIVSSTPMSRINYEDCWPVRHETGWPTKTTRESDLIPVELYIRKKVAEDPSFASTKLFQKHAPRDLKSEHPEAGSDFGFFDSRRVECFDSFHYLSVMESTKRPEHPRGWVKYPRTPHLPWSPGVGRDDLVLPDASQFVGQEVMVSVKMDGECTTLRSDGLHARSLDWSTGPGRGWIKGEVWARVARDIPEGWRVCGENLRAVHSIEYDDLPAHFMVFSVWDDRNRCLSWDETTEWATLLGLETVPVLYRGPWDEAAIRAIRLDSKKQEGYVVRLARGFPYEEFGRSVAKYVRVGHVATDQHWSRKRERINRLGDHPKKS